MLLKISLENYENGFYVYAKPNLCDMDTVVKSLQRPKFNYKMEFLKLYHKHKPVSLEELYKRATAKYHCRSSGKCA